MKNLLFTAVAVIGFSVASMASAVKESSKVNAIGGASCEEIATFDTHMAEAQHERLFGECFSSGEYNRSYSAHLRMCNDQNTHPITAGAPRLLLDTEGGKFTKK
jgi:hypothetical protein